MATYSKNLKKVKEHLDFSEKIIFSCYGAFKTKIMGSDSQRNGVFIATENRIVFFANKLIGYQLESFYFEKISSIEMSKGIMGKKIKFMMSNNSATMKWILLGEPEKLVNFVRENMGDKYKKVNDDIPKQIRKLSDLRDDGILSNDEFESKKLELLSKM